MPVERICFTFELRPGTEEEYKRRHYEIWPKLVEAILAAGGVLVQPSFP